MSKKSNHPESATKSNIKIAGMVILLISAATYGWSVYSKSTRGLPPRETAEAGAFEGNREGRRGPGEGFRRNPEERRERFAGMMDELGLTPEQKAKMDELQSGEWPEGREGWEARREAMNQILTQEQQEQMRQQFLNRGQQFMAQRLQEAQKTLSPEDFSTFQKRIEERMARRAGRGGGGPGGPRGPR